MTIHEPRERLRALSKQHRTGLGDLAAMIGRPRTYLRRYVREGRPDQLEDGDRETLCRFFGVPEAELGGVDPRWAKFQVAK
ncbi:helix-turn-helix domain-containing protein [Sphingomonas sp. IC4-52]|uniref:helix-turn-helix domain-containing protein n=1 Tax=Sphingomonas sp. IC4-52 TaxID=2887202 RepID=UPI001D10F21E|nr:helix-turn-helix transcriptional regulator [Sphingomonas sp. IC4-52]MCC2978813.1 helix-turn-helix domain-containing protein [Sphingomonas sp. IC4-52]